MMPFRVESETDGAAQVFAAAILILIIVLQTKTWREGVYTIRDAITIGALSGIGLLISPTLVLAMAVMLVLTVLRAQKFSRLLPYVVCLALACAVVVAPWIIRNRLRFGTWFFLRDNFWLELYVGHNPGAKPDIARNYSRADVPHPSVNRELAQKLAAEGEIAFNRWARGQAIRYIRSHPVETAKLTARRAILFCFPVTPNRLVSAAFALVTLLALAGLALMLLQRQFAALIMAGMWVTFWPFQSLFQTSARYRFPIEWTVLLSAGYLIWVACKLVPPIGAYGAANTSLTRRNRLLAGYARAQCRFRRVSGTTSN
jgi:hypothetical protein